MLFILGLLQFLMNHFRLMLDMQKTEISSRGRPLLLFSASLYAPEEALPEQPFHVRGSILDVR